MGDCCLLNGWRKMAFNNVKTLDREACFKYIKNIGVNRI